MENIHDRDGKEVDLPDWIRNQVSSAQSGFSDLRDLEGLTDDQIIHLWVPLFAAKVRDLCETYGIDVETMRNRMMDVAGSATRHIENLKLYLSQHVGHDVGLMEAVDHIDVVLEPKEQDGRRIGVVVKVFYPPIEHGRGYADEFMLPIYSRPVVAPAEDTSGNPLVPIQLQTYQQVNDLLSA